MEFTFTIEGRLPSLNEYIQADRSNRYAGHKFKTDHQNQVEQAIKSVTPIVLSLPSVIEYRWFEMNRRRDLDNVSGFGHKVIQDALVSCGIIEDDDMDHIIGYRDYFYVDKEHPRIEVTVKEV